MKMKMKIRLLSSLMVVALLLGSIGSGGPGAVSPCHFNDDGPIVVIGVR